MFHKALWTLSDVEHHHISVSYLCGRSSSNTTIHTVCSHNWEYTMEWRLCKSWIPIKTKANQLSSKQLSSMLWCLRFYRCCCFIPVFPTETYTVVLYHHNNYINYKYICNHICNYLYLSIKTHWHPRLIWTKKAVKRLSLLFSAWSYSQNIILI